MTPDERAQLDAYAIRFGMDSEAKMEMEAAIAIAKAWDKALPEIDDILKIDIDMLLAMGELKLALRRHQTLSAADSVRYWAERAAGDRVRYWAERVAALAEGFLLE